MNGRSRSLARAGAGDLDRPRHAGRPRRLATEAPGVEGSADRRRRGARARAAPSSCRRRGDWPTLKPRDYEYRHVRFPASMITRQALVFRALASPRGRYGGPGYLVMTPLRLASGAIVLVNRGFVPEERKDQAEAGPAAAVEGGDVGLSRLVGHGFVAQTVAQAHDQLLRAVVDDGGGCGGGDLGIGRDR